MKFIYFLEEPFGNLFKKKPKRKEKSIHRLSVGQIFAVNVAQHSTAHNSRHFVLSRTDRPTPLPAWAPSLTHSPSPVFAYWMFASVCWEIIAISKSSGESIQEYNKNAICVVRLTLGDTDK